MSALNEGMRLTQLIRQKSSRDAVSATDSVWLGDDSEDDSCAVSAASHNAVVLSSALTVVAVDLAPDDSENIGSQPLDIIDVQATGCNSRGTLSGNRQP